MSTRDASATELLVRKALQALEDIDFDRYMALWHEECRVEYPTHLPQMPGVIIGKASLGEHNQRAFHNIDHREIRDLTVRPLADPGFALAEFVLAQSFGGGAGSFEGRVCVIFGARDGKLDSMREYIDTRLLSEAISAYDKMAAKAS